MDPSAIKNAKAYTGTAGLQFLVNDERYQLHRSNRKNGSSSVLKKNGTWQVIFDEQRIRVTETLLQETIRDYMHEQLAHSQHSSVKVRFLNFLRGKSTTRRDILHTLLGIDRLIEVRQRFIETRRIAGREQRRIQAHQNSLRFNAQNVHETEIARIEAKFKKIWKPLMVPRPVIQHSSRNGYSTRTRLQKTVDHPQSSNKMTP